MKQTLLCAAALLVFFTGFAQQKQPAISIIPEPVSIETLEGQVLINAQTKYFTNSESAEKIAQLFAEFVEANYGIVLQKGTMQNSYLIFSDDDVPAKEGYQLTVARNKIVLQGQHAGMFYGMQTLLQLLNGDVKGKLTVPGVLVRDEPRFAYRGLMLDVSRHYFPLSYIKHYIDIMARYKMNRFHWHLTDDQGWRIEIKQFPRLQSIASQRKESPVKRTAEKDGTPHGGIYTQEEVKEIVAYAAERYITVIPEIEMPGHAQAALAAYPDLGCTGGPYEVSTHWGVHKEVFCAGNDSVFTFLERVLDEVIPLFPGQYIHIGGDECPKDRWKTCAKCQARIKAQNLKDEHELQSYFIQRMEKYVNRKGKRIIGWDEILEGGLAPDATVMSWRGEEGGLAAAKQKHDVIMTPNTYLYLDYYQAAPATEPHAFGGYLPLDKVYSYEPYPASLTKDEQQYIKGVQGNLWTEYIGNGPYVDYMVYPRALALSEIQWSPASKKNFARFSDKLPKELAAMEALGVNFRVPEPGGLADDVITGTNATVTLTPSVAGSTIRYTIDDSDPTANSTLYTKPFPVTPPANGSTTVKCIVITPGGRKSAVYSATYMRKNFINAANVNPTKKGVRMEAFFRRVRSAKDLSGKADSLGTATAFDLRPFAAKSAFALRFEGYIKIEADGIYEFRTSSDDGSVLMIGNELVVDNDGEHAAMEKSGMLPLRKGFHPIRVQYFDAGGGKSLQVSVHLKGKQSINLRNVLFH